MKNNENPIQKPRGKLSTRILKYLAIIVILIVIVVVFVYPKELKQGKKLIKEGNYEAAITEFIQGLDKYYSDSFSSKIGIFDAIERMSYKARLKSFYYNIGLSYEGIGQFLEDSNSIKESFPYYSYALEAYNKSLIVKEDNEKVFKAKAALEDKFSILFGEPYAYGTILMIEEYGESNATLTSDEINIIVRRLMIAAKILINEARYAEAIYQCDVALTYLPNSVNIHLAKLESLFALEKYQEAQDTVQNILVIDPNNEIAKKYHKLLVDDNFI